MNAIAHRLTQITMIAATLAAGVMAHPVQAADPVLVRLPPVVVIGHRVPVVQLATVVVTGHRVAPASTLVAQRAPRNVAGRG